MYFLPLKSKYKLPNQNLIIFGPRNGPNMIRAWFVDLYFDIRGWKYIYHQVQNSIDISTVTLMPVARSAKYLNYLFTPEERTSVLETWSCKINDSLIWLLFMNIWIQMYMTIRQNFSFLKNFKKYPKLGYFTFKIRNSLKFRIFFFKFFKNYFGS